MIRRIGVHKANGISGANRERGGKKAAGFHADFHGGIAQIVSWRFVFGHLIGRRGGLVCCRNSGRTIASGAKEHKEGKAEKRNVFHTRKNEITKKRFVKPSIAGA